MKKYIILILIGFLGNLISSCTSRNQLPETNQWQGGVIKSAGVYSYKDNNLKLKVYIENKLIKYQMIDSTGKELFRNDEYAASVLHNWAFYLDDRKNLWCLSSDLGHLEWKFDKEQMRYVLVRLPRNINKQDIPTSLYNDLNEFFD